MSMVDNVEYPPSQKNGTALGVPLMNRAYVSFFVNETGGRDAT